MNLEDLERQKQTVQSETEKLMLENTRRRHVSDLRVCGVTSWLSYSYKLLSAVCLCVWMLTRVAQMVTAAHRDL